MSVAGDIIDDLKFDRSDKVRAITGFTGIFTASIFVVISVFSLPESASAGQVQASGLMIEKAATSFVGGAH